MTAINRGSLHPPPRRTGKGFIERAIRYLETSFLPWLSAPPTDLDALQRAADAWTVSVADHRRPRRLAGTVADALAVERAALRPPPTVWPDTDRHLEVRASRDGFVRVADVDYSVPPRLVGRRLAARLSLTELRLFCDGEQVAAHPRSWVRADVVLSPEHARQLRLARQAEHRLATGDEAVEAPSLAVYDELAS